METVTVYQFEYFDRTTGEITRSDVWATAKAIAEVGATIVEGSGKEVEARRVHVNGIVFSRID